jgi:hypothetical protein
MHRGFSALLFVIFAGLAVPAAQPQSTDMRTLDELDNVSTWRTIASDGVSASVHEARGMQGGALVLEFDFAKTAGYAAASRAMPVELPDDYEISFWMRGEASRNHFEVKFVDQSGDNVWWFRRPDHTFSGDWQQVRIKRRQIEFAWGPTEDKTLRRFASIEFVVSAGRGGGKGNLWFDRLTLKPVTRATNLPPSELTSSSEDDSNRASLAMDGKSDTAWRSRRGDSTAQFIQVDLREVREFGGIEIDWLRDASASRYRIETSLDGKQWQAVRHVHAGNGGRDSHLLPESEARFVRVSIPEPGAGVGIAEIHLRDIEFGASPNAFITSLAKQARRGCYPRGFRDEQSYWTILGVDGDNEESMLSEDGAIEARKAGFSVEPFVRTSSGLVTWADVTATQSLAEGYLPIPTVQWKHPEFELRTTASAGGKPGVSLTRVTYALKNPGRTARRLTLALAVRPFQVNPATQFLNTTGGVSQIQDIAWKNGAVEVDRAPAVFPRTVPQSFRAVALDSGTPCEWLLSNVGATEVRDETGFASAALLFDVELAAGAQKEISLDLPLHGNLHEQAKRAAIDASPQTVAREWREKLNRVQLTLPPDGQAWFDTLRTSLAHVHINRDGPALQPGSRAYERSWIRDGAMTSEMLLRLGDEETVREFLNWYAGFQFANGKVPCCVDVRGADPVPENDSGGEFLFLIDVTHRYTHDRALLEKLWPNVVNAVDYMERLRQSERTPQNLEGDRRVFYGLMPASISHEGYSAKPMHSYWDDFWALAGYESAVRIARALEKKEEMRRFIAARDEFRSDLYRSLDLALKQHKIDYIPGAAELGDFDATSTSIAISPVGEQQMLPPAAMLETFQKYWREFQRRRTDRNWDAYTPYELRNLGTFIRLGWRERGLELLQFFMNDRRPGTWNQWAEVVGREVRKPRFVGDMPHGWVASDYGRSLLDMFAFERPADDTLVLMAGVPRQWLRKQGFAIKNLRTPYGLLSYSLTVKGKQRTLQIDDIKLPVGGIVIAWPPGEPALDQDIQQGSARWIGEELRVAKVPFRVVLSQ